MEILKINPGADISVAIMPWDGITVPNAAIVSEPVANSSVFTSVEVKRVIIRTDHPQEGVCLPEEISESERKELGFTTSLDEDGIIRIGQTVDYNDVLVARMVKKEAGDLNTAEQKMLTAIFRFIFEDESERMPYRDQAIVLDIEKQATRLIIYLAIKRNLRIGDVLSDQNGKEVIVSAIVPSSQMPQLHESHYHRNFTVGMVITSPSEMIDSLADRIWNSEEDARVLHSVQNPGSILIHYAEDTIRMGKKWINKNERVLLGDLFLRKKVERIEQKANAFGTSGFSLTHQSLVEGIKIKPRQLAVYNSKGLEANVKELLSAKSDDGAAYSAALSSIVKGDSFPEIIDAASMRKFQALLRAMCFKLIVENGEGKISFLTAAEMQESYGEVTKSDMINYKTDVPIPDGLCCQKIFGPVKSSDRYKRFGHIKLSVPVVHPFFQKQMNIFLKDIGKYVEAKQIESTEHREFIDVFHEFVREKVGVDYTIMNLPVLPQGLRPLYSVGGGKFVTDGLNDLYRRVIIRNGRVKRLIEIKAPYVILENEVRMLQESVQSVLEGLNYESDDNDRHGLKGLTHGFAEWNKKLFNKAVSYAAFGTVVPDPNLAPDECAMPSWIAYKVFEPYVCRHLMGNTTETIEKNYLDMEETYTKPPVANTYKEAREMLENPSAEVTAALTETLKDLLVLVSPATYNEVFAFRPKVSEGEVIRLHPSAILRLGILLDKKGKAILHLPLSPTAQAEAAKIIFNPEVITEPSANEFTSGLQLTKKDLCEIAIAKQSGKIKLSEFDKVLLNVK